MSFFNKILKSFLGDKNQRDLKEVGKIVAKIKKVEPAIKELSDDELRGKSREFKEKIKTATADITTQIEQIKEQIKTTANIDEKEALFSKIETLQKDAYQIEEKVLNEILPEAFAVLKDTGRRWAENGQIVVQATDRDRELAATKDFVEIQGVNEDIEEYKKLVNHLLGMKNTIFKSTSIGSKLPFLNGTKLIDLQVIPG